MVTIQQPIDIRIVQGLDKGKTLAVSLPKSWMNVLNIKKGDRVKLTRTEDHIILEKIII